MELQGPEGFFAGAGMLILPFVILYILVRILPPWPDVEARLESQPPAAIAAAPAEQA